MSWDGHRLYGPEADRQHKVREGYIKADRAVAHFVIEMRRRGLPGVQSVPYPNVALHDRGWQHLANVSPDGRFTQLFELIIQEDGKFWAVGSHSPGGRDGGGSSSFIVRILKGRSFVFYHPKGAYEDPNEPRTRLVGQFGYLLPPFQLLLVEMLRKYSLPLPRD